MSDNENLSEIQANPNAALGVEKREDFWRRARAALAFCDRVSISCETVDEIFEDILSALRRDRRFLNLSSREFDLLVADARKRADTTIEDVLELEGAIREHDALYAVTREFTDDETEETETR